MNMPTIRKHDCVGDSKEITGKDVRLEPWMEILGILHNFGDNDGYLFLKIGKAILSFKLESK
jgi:hypothetical protein